MISRRSSRNRHQSRLGAVAVEFALTAPIVLLIVFAGWEFARINMIRNTMDNACYESAREGVLPGATPAKMTAKATTILDAVGVQGAVVTITPQTITTGTDQVTCSVTVPFANNSYGAVRFLTAGQLARSCTLSRELLPGLQQP